MGLIRKTTTVSEVPQLQTVVKNICNAFLISPKLVASLGSCTNKMEKECGESYENCKFLNGMKERDDFKATSYDIDHVKNFAKYKKPKDANIDFGLIIVSSLIHVYIL